VLGKTFSLNKKLGYYPKKFEVHVFVPVYVKAVENYLKRPDTNMYSRVKLFMLMNVSMYIGRHIPT
jgi:hypothetical protein